MLEISFFPIYGFMLGINYWNEELDELENKHPDTQHMIQVMFLFFGVSFAWYE